MRRIFPKTESGNAPSLNREYLLRERPGRALWLLALPMMVGNLFQQFYTMADSMIVGRCVSEEALAAIGASYSLTNVFICIAIGGGAGASVLTGRCFGAREYGRLRLSVSTALLSFLALSLLLASLGLYFGDVLLRLLHTPENIFYMAAEYLDIYFFGLPFLFLYNVLSAIFNALGRSRVPLRLLIFSSLLNISLDICFVAGLDLGLQGAAWATLIAQGFSACLSFLLLLRELKAYPARESSEGADISGSAALPALPPAARLFSPREFRSICRVALPSVLQQSTVSIGMMLVQSVVNAFGSQVLAGYSAAARVESLCFVPMAALGNALSSYTAQNLGAARKAAAKEGLSVPDTKRVREGYHAALRLTALFAVLLCIFLEFFCRPLIAAFLGNGDTRTALAVGNGYLRFIGFFFGLIGLKMCTDGLLRGAADMKLFTIANLTNLTLRVVFSSVMAPRFGVAMVWYAIPLG